MRSSHWTSSRPPLWRWLLPRGAEVLGAHRSAGGQASGSPRHQWAEANLRSRLDFKAQALRFPQSGRLGVAERLISVAPGAEEGPEHTGQHGQPEPSDHSSHLGPPGQHGGPRDGPWLAPLPAGAPCALAPPGGIPCERGHSGLLWVLSLTSVGLYICCLSQMGPTSFDGLTVVATSIYTCCAALSCGFLRPVSRLGAC